MADPVGQGLIASFARPAGDDHRSLETGKRLELIKETIPSLKSVMIFTQRESPVNAVALNGAELAVPRLGLRRASSRCVMPMNSNLRSQRWLARHPPDF